MNENNNNYTLRDVIITFTIFKTFRIPRECFDFIIKSNTVKHTHEVMLRDLRQHCHLLLPSRG